MNKWFGIAMAAVLGIMLVGCQGAAEAGKEAGEGANAAMDKAGDAVEAGAEKAGDAAAAAGDAAKTAMGGSDIVDTAVANGSFGTLAALLTEAGLVETLKGDGPFTVFAPTDAAFLKVDAKALEDLKADKTKLGDVLKAHVVAGKVMAADVVKLTEVETLQGSKFPVKVEGEKVMIGDATVSQADVAAKNGVIHVIDTVLMPAK
jgi:uncharacterized surface protein with fasciclin (FAS1) repeats